MLKDLSFPIIWCNTMLSSAHSFKPIRLEQIENHLIIFQIKLGFFPGTERMFSF